MQPTKLDNQTLIKIAALAGCDPRTAKKHVFADPHAPINAKAGSYVVRAAVIRAAEQLGVRR